MVNGYFALNKRSLDYACIFKTPCLVLLVVVLWVAVWWVAVCVK